MSEVQSQVVKIVVEQLDVDPRKVTPNATFADDLGADSLAIVEIVMAIEEKFSIEIPDNVAEKIVKIQDAVDYIEDQLKKAA